MLRKRSLVFIVILFTLSGCRKSPTIAPSFYYWKTIFQISSAEIQLLDTLHISRIYLRCFDIVYKAEQKKLIPESPIIFSSKVPEKIEIVPVIYITNKSFLQIIEDSIPDLALKIISFTNNCLAPQKIQYHEMQIDCDWTETTRSKYFLLLKVLREKLSPQHKTLSATLRLHQIKYKRKTGVPPVDRGMLMFYNMGSLSAQNKNNSIYNAEIATQYINYLKDYPLKLDMALPIFTWGVHLRSGKILSLVNNLSTDEATASNLFHESTAGLLVAKSGFFFHGEYYQQYDQLRMEEITPEIAKKAALQLAEKLTITDSTNIVLYHFDSTNLSRYEVKDFNQLYHTFN